ncbi:hypothetical protein PsorP6_007043 [Peronosclerospora sorghi]|uniref:Uncharacterized protein n=1 Tax=Peronosclerospora sorghi TaxID=230839 RepID=A0ACC0WAV9_9STRA|nr:hypothetical protein PsorP6_007043 [Peronosclerospora sorghi]
MSSSETDASSSSAPGADGSGCSAACSLRNVRATPSVPSSLAPMETQNTLTRMTTIEGRDASRRACVLAPPSLKRIVLNPRAYLTPFSILILGHHLPVLIAYGAMQHAHVTTVKHACARLAHLSHWLFVAFFFHLVLAVLMLANVLYTLSTRVYHERRPEGWLILLIFLGYGANLGWATYGEADFRTDTTLCDDGDDVQTRAHAIGAVQHFDFIFTLCVVATGACTSYMCGVHSGDDVTEAERRWQRRCLCCFHACTCHKTVEHEGDDDVFESLGRVLGKFFVVRYKTNRYEGLSCTDLKFSLDLVAQMQAQERAEETHARLDRAAQGLATVHHFAPEDEERRLRDLAFYCRLAIGIYGWPIYVWYAPCYWFRIFGCCKQPLEDQVFEHDNVVHGNRASFLNYTGVQTRDLVYLNCHNFVFEAPYCIVRDRARRELILSVRGSMSFYDFVTDGLAQIVRMAPQELPEDIPYAFDTRTHYGMLCTARQIFKNLQEGTRKPVFWDFALAHCAVDRRHAPKAAAAPPLPRPWHIVVCGHSMGAGVGCILAILLRKIFPATTAFLYAPPPLLDPETARWTKSFATTAVYGDDLVPRLSISNLSQLRDEMATQYDAVATEPLYKVKFRRHWTYKRVHDAAPEPATDARSTQVDTSSHATSLLHVGRASSDFGATGLDLRPRPSRDLSNATMITLPQEDATQEVDVPGEIVHIETVARARRCGCTMLLGEQALQYTLRDARYFRRILVTPRAVQDHMVHHYDRKIRHLVHQCMEFESPVAAPRQAGTASWRQDEPHEGERTPEAGYEEIAAVV